MSPDESDPVLLLTDTLFRKGWASVLPPSAIDILEVLSDGRPPVLDEIDARLRAWTTRSEGLDSPAWLTTETWFRSDGPDADISTSGAPLASAPHEAHVDRAA